ncbi:MAG: hypothetical protein WCS54_01650 [Fibrobacteraceae bacterium]
MRQYLYIPYFSFLLFYITGAFANPTPHISSSKDTAFYKGEQGGQYIVITTVQRDSTNRISPEKKYPSARSSIRYVDPQGNYVTQARHYSFEGREPAIAKRDSAIQIQKEFQTEIAAFKDDDSTRIYKDSMNAYLRSKTSKSAGGTFLFAGGIVTAVIGFDAVLISLMLSPLATDTDALNHSILAFSAITVGGIGISYGGHLLRASGTVDQNKAEIFKQKNNAYKLRQVQKNPITLRLSPTIDRMHRRAGVNFALGF